MILRSNSNQKYILFYECSYLCMFATVQPGHPKSPARTNVNLWKISLWKNKVNIIILITLVIQYGNSNINLKSEDLWSNTFVETKTGAPSFLRCQGPSMAPMNLALYFYTHHSEIIFFSFLCVPFCAI